MANLKYSRQREAIKDYLSSVTTHPTADTVYMHIKEEFPNIEKMKSYELLVARTNPHYHFYCKCCKRMIDMDFDHMDKINQLASESFDGQIESHTMLFYGICGDCLRKS